MQMATCNTSIELLISQDNTYIQLIKHFLVYGGTLEIFKLNEKYK